MNSKTYLVGGAVRDDLLGLEPRAPDRVVVGSRPEALLEQGFRQVGAAFPVFLHPESGEEYALARKEKKSGHGYHGFTVDFGPEVTLEEDLARRDLTINAMARDDAGNLIDPHGGQADLEARILRHVSPAFVEDPLRVIRVARFAARLAAFEFAVHPDTIALMREIVDSGELQHLAAERIWSEIEDALATSQPGRFVEVLRDCGALQVLLPEVDALFGVPQTKKYHPEIDTGVHLIMSLNMAAQLGDKAPDPQVVFAVLLHDLGKGLTPPEHLPSHVGHEAAGMPLVKAVCERLKAPNEFRDLALMVCLHHLNCHRAMELRPQTILKIFEQADLIRRPDRLPRFLAACEADARGRLGMESRAFPQAERLTVALKAALAVKARDLDVSGSGPEVGQALHEARVQAITDALVTFLD